MKNIILVLPFFAICLQQVNTVSAQQIAKHKKLIHLGWELTTPQVVKANYQKMEATYIFG